MKNLIEFNNNVTCWCCKLNGFFVQTPFGGDNTTCPLCDNFDFQSSSEFDKYGIDIFDLDDNDNMFIYYCNSCRIVYDIGCTHAENGCTDGIRNGHLIGKWKHKPTDEVYVGMPQFNDSDEWVKTINDIEILEWVCPNYGFQCSKGFYPKSTHPQYYKDCPLLKK